MRPAALLALALLTASTALAQPASSPADLIRAMEDAVVRLDYDVAEARAREALARFDALTPDQLVTVHSALGVLLYARNEPVEARRQFEAALSLNPALSLDPVRTSPKTLEFFGEVRSDAVSEAGGGTRAEPAVRYVVLEDRRPGAALRSLAVPGWGQFHKGDRAKGWAFAAATGALVAGAFAAQGARAAAREDYLAAPTEAEAARRFAPYNRWHRARNALALGAGAVWAASALEALLTGGPEAPPSLAVEPAPEVVGLRLRVRM